MTRFLMSGVAIAALVAFGSMADAQQAQQPATQTQPNQGAGSGPDTGAGGAAGTDVQTQGGAGAGADTQSGAQSQMPEASQPGQAQQKSTDGTKKSSDSTEKQSGESQKGADKTKKQSQSGQDSGGATGATGKAGKIDVPEGKRSQVAKSFSSHKVKHVDVDFNVSIGVAVPTTVVLHPVPVDIVEIVPAFRGYRYFVLASGEIVIVDPDSMVVVYVLAA